MPISRRAPEIFTTSPQRATSPRSSRSNSPGVLPTIGNMVHRGIKILTCMLAKLQNAPKSPTQIPEEPYFLITKRLLSADAIRITRMGVDSDSP